MKFETVRIYFLSEFSVCCHPKILLPWQRDVTTFSLYYSTLDNDLSALARLAFYENSLIEQEISVRCQH